MYHKSKQIIWECLLSPMFNCCHFVNLSGHESLIKYYYHLCALLLQNVQWAPMVPNIGYFNPAFQMDWHFFLLVPRVPANAKSKNLLDEFDLFVLMSHPQITRLQLTHAHKMYKHFSKASLKFRLPSKNHTNSKKGLMWIFLNENIPM